MKNSKYILIIIAVVILILVGLTKNKKEVVDNDQQNEGVSICYIWNTEAGDSASLRMNFSGAGGSNVSGNFSFSPYEKDSKSGSFEGIALPLDQASMSRTAKVMWQATGEGITNTEELYIRFGEGDATPAFGQMKDRGDGVYVYSDPANLSYPIILQQTDCSDPSLN